MTDPQLQLRLQLLGAPRLIVAEGAARPLNRADAALLALLAIEGPTSRARAIGLLWPDSDEPAARNALRQRLFRLRRTAGADLIDAAEWLSLAPGVAGRRPTLTIKIGRIGNDMVKAARFQIRRQLGQIGGNDIDTQVIFGRIPAREVGVSWL